MKQNAKLRSALRLMLAMIFISGTCWAASAQGPAGEEYRVYEAVLNSINSIPKAEPSVAIYDRTLNSSCDAASNNPIFANGCSFLWVRPDTDEAVEQMLRKRFHGLERSTWKNFKAANASSITLHDSITTTFKHRIVGSETPAGASEDWQSPDMTIYFSRVGFNSKKTEALVYVLAFSYIGRNAATGDYLRLRLGTDKLWTLAGRVRYMIEDDDIFVWASPQRRTSAGMPHLQPVAESK